MHLKRSVQLFPHVDPGPRQDPLGEPAPIDPERIPFAATSWSWPGIKGAVEIRW